MVKPGRLVAAGRTSEVFAYGTGSVVKVPRPEVPSHWARLEAGFTEAVRLHGVPAPEVKGVVEIDGREAIVFERIDGPSMWNLMVQGPDDAESLARELAAVHQEIQRAGLPDGLPDLVGRVCNKISEVGRLDRSERDEACQLAKSLPRGAALLHGDLHPGNVLMNPRGPVVIDWFDATIGHPVADVVRSSILIRPPVVSGDFPDLRAAPPGLLMRILDAYLREFEQLLVHDATHLARWEAVVAISRLSEGAQQDVSGLLELWESRGAESASRPLQQAVSGAVGRLDQVAESVEDVG